MTAALFLALVGPAHAADPTQALVIRATTTGDAGIILFANFTGTGAIFASSFKDGATVTWLVFLGTESETRVELTESGETRAVVREGPPVKLASQAYMPDAGTYTVVFAFFGELESSAWWPRGAVESYEIIAEPAVHWLSDVGDAGHGANVRVHGAGVASPILLSKRIPIEHTLLGWFVPPVLTAHAHAGLVTLAGPEGSDVCPCVYHDATGPAARGPGDYDLSWVGATASVSNAIRAGWIDADLGS